MRLPWSSEKILGWRTRYDAVRRWGDRCRNCYDGDSCINDDDFVEFFLAFAIMCYSLRDFAIRTGGISQGEMDQLMGNCESMRLCRDICNRGKHHTLTRTPSGDATWSLSREYIPWSDGEHKWFLIAEGEKCDPLHLVGECERFWRSLIAQRRFTEPPDPFSRKSGEG